MLRQYTWKKNDPEGVHGLSRAVPFVAIDPDGAGAIMGWQQPRPWPAGPDLIEALTPARYERILDRCVEMGVEVAVVEDAYTHPQNLRSGLQLARNTGIFLGALAQALRGPDFVLTVVMVHAQTWQYGVLKLPKKPKRADRKAASMEVAETALSGQVAFQSASEAVRQGMADAYGIARWWQEARKW